MISDQFTYVRGVRSLGINGSVLCTDALEHLNVSCVMKAAQRIGAHDVYVVRFDQTVAHFFELNRGTRIS